jgi:hypothetical protein
VNYLQPRVLKISHLPCCYTYERDRFFHIMFILVAQFYYDF